MFYIIFVAHGHMLQKAVGPNGVLLVAFLSFPNECEFVVVKMHDNGAGAGAVKFSPVCRLFGPQVLFTSLNIDNNYINAFYICRLIKSLITFLLTTFTSSNLIWIA